MLRVSLFSLVELPERNAFGRLVYLALGDGVSALAMLGVTFGGFSPTAMDGVAASKEMVIRSEKMRAQQREAEKRRREIERARASAPKRFTDENGCIWTYVVMDNSFVRIENCKRECETMVIPARNYNAITI